MREKLKINLFAIVLAIVILPQVRANKKIVLNHYFEIEPIQKSIKLLQVDEYLSRSSELKKESLETLKKEVSKVIKEIEGAILEERKIEVSLKNITSQKIKNFIILYNGIKSFNQDIDKTALILTLRQNELFKTNVLETLNNIYTIKNKDLSIIISDVIKDELNININTSYDKLASNLSKMSEKFKKIQQQIEVERVNFQNDVKGAHRHVYNEIDNIKTSIETKKEALNNNINNFSQNLQDKVEGLRESLDVEKQFRKKFNSEVANFENTTFAQVQSLRDSLKKVSHVVSDIDKYAQQGIQTLEEIQDFKFELNFDSYTNDQKVGFAIHALSKIDPNLSNKIGDIYNSYKQVEQVYNIANAFMNGGASSLLMATGPIGIAFVAMQSISANSSSQAQMAMLKKILEEIQALKDMVKDLKEEMLLQFDLLFTRLDRQDEMIKSHFGEVFKRLDQQRKLLEGLYIQQIDMDRRLSAMSYENNTLLRSLSQRAVDGISANCDLSTMRRNDLDHFNRCATLLYNEIKYSFVDVEIDRTSDFISSDINESDFYFNTLLLIDKNISRREIPHMNKLMSSIENYISFLNQLMKRNVSLDSILYQQIDRDVNEIIEIVEKQSTNFNKLTDSQSYKSVLNKYFKALINKKDSIERIYKSVLLEEASEVFGTTTDELSRFLSFHNISINNQSNIDNILNAFQSIRTIQSSTTIPLSSLQSFNEQSGVIKPCSGGVTKVDNIDLRKIQVPHILKDFEYKKGIYELCVVNKKRFTTHLNLEMDSGVGHSYQNFYYKAKYGVLFALKFKDANKKNLFARFFDSKLELKEGKLKTLEHYSEILKFAIYSSIPMTYSLHHVHEGAHGRAGHRRDHANIDNLRSSGLCKNLSCRYVTKLGAYRHGKNHVVVHEIQLSDFNYKVNLFDTYNESLIQRSIHDIDNFMRKHFKHLRAPESKLSDEQGYKKVISDFNQHGPQRRHSSRSKSLLNYTLNLTLRVDPFVMNHMNNNFNTKARLSYKSNVEQIFENQVSVAKDLVELSKNKFLASYGLYQDTGSSIDTISSSLPSVVKFSRAIKQYGTARNNLYRFISLVHRDKLYESDILFNLFYAKDRENRLPFAQDIIRSLNHSMEESRTVLDMPLLINEVINLTTPHHFNILSGYSLKLNDIKDSYSAQLDFDDIEI